MSLIVMAVYSTEENQKDQYLSRTLESLEKTVDFSKHRLILSVNSYTAVTQLIFRNYRDIISDIIWNDKNLGTAEAINKGWRKRKLDENAIKMDDDVVIHEKGWADLMDDICNNNRFIGQVGLKRPDLIENPNHPDSFYRSQMIEYFLSDGKIILEKCHHIMGTCVMHSDNLLNEIGYMWQPALYGFDDSLMSLRSELAGYNNCFIPNIKIEHIDKGQTPFQTWKHGEADIYLKQDNQGISIYKTIVQEYKLEKRPIHYNPFV